MLAQSRLGDAEHARNVRFGDAVGGHRLGLPPLRVSRGPDRSSRWKSQPTIIALYGKGLACPLRGDVVEASTVALEHRLLAGEVRVELGTAMLTQGRLRDSEQARTT